MVAGLLDLPDGLPVPEDDGAASHLLGASMPPVALPAATGGTRRVDRLGPLAVVFCFPRTGRPGLDLPAGWDELPGARGCTVEACAFRSLWDQFGDMGATVVGVSTQSTEEQQEARLRLRLPFELLSDAGGMLRRQLQLPLFELDDAIYLRRLTLIVRGGIITRTYYPVFPPDRHPADVLASLAPPLAAD